MLIKLIGSVFLLSAGALAAHTTAGYEKQRLAVLDAWITLIDYIRVQIDCYLLPLSEILAEADKSLFRACMCPSPSPTPEELYQSSLLYLSPDARRLISSFVREIGKSNREEQVRRCAYYVAGLENVRSRIAEELQGRIRVGCTLSLSTAMALTILCW